jgi:hypothetical protein
MGVENMGIPLNSSYDDFGIALDETTVQGFFSSNRRRGVNDDDIYRIYIEKPSKFIIRIIDSLTQELISYSEVSVTDAVKTPTPTDISQTGEFTAKLWDQTVYQVNARANGYIEKIL